MSFKRNTTVFFQTVGTVLATSTRALDRDLVSQIRGSLQDALNQATKTKQSSQQLIGQFVEVISVSGVFIESDSASANTNSGTSASGRKQAIKGQTHTSNCKSR
ncbi:hypothetical protein BGZ76_003174, partial [Entomortierella beljakovae]